MPAGATGTGAQLAAGTPIERGNLCCVGIESFADDAVRTVGESGQRQARSGPAQRGREAGPRGAAPREAHSRLVHVLDVIVRPLAWLRARARNWRNARARSDSSSARNPA